MKIYYGEVSTTKNIDDANCVTHSGTFHADEVFATTILSVIYDVTVLRVNEVTEQMKSEDKIIYDVGLGKLDHHQVGGNGRRENGVPYAACGLVWKKYGKEVLEKLNIGSKKIDYLIKQIDRNIIQFIDADDNGTSPDIDTDYKYVTLSSIIAGFNPNWDDEDVEADKRFLDAVALAKTIFENILSNELSKLEAKDILEEKIKESSNGIMVLDRFMPWKELLLDSKNEKAKDVLYVVFPSNRGGYNVYAVPKSKGSFENRKSLPKKWSGLRDEKLQEITGVKTARFCHIACFICTAQTLDDAIKLATLAKEN